MQQSSLGPAFFARIYADSDDPWDFATSVYENAKYHATIDALGGRHFTSLLEIGCSIGVLSAMLAGVSDRVIAIDINERALATARQRCDHIRNIAFRQMAFPTELPSESFDAIVLSEVAYYWADDDLGRAIEFAATAPAGTIIVLVHFLPRVPEYVRDGDAVHAAFLADDRFSRVNAARTDRYRLDVLSVNEMNGRYSGTERSSVAGGATTSVNSSAFDLR